MTIFQTPSPQKSHPRNKNKHVSFPLKRSNFLWWMLNHSKVKSVSRLQEIPFTGAAKTTDSDDDADDDDDDGRGGKWGEDLSVTRSVSTGNLSYDKVESLEKHNFSVSRNRESTAKRLVTLPQSLISCIGVTQK